MIPFRFDHVGHRYYVEGLAGFEAVPNITGMLQATGWVDPTFYTDEGRERGTAVHDLTAAFDLGALDLAACVSSVRPYLLQHAKAISIVRPQWLHVEVPFVHAQHRYGGRPDRVGRVYGAQAVAEVKSGAPHKSHGIQLALQAILVADELNLPAEMIQRYGWYLTPRAFKVHLFPDVSDFTEARDVIRKCCGR